MEKNPERRFDSCKAFVESLRFPRFGSTHGKFTGNHSDRELQSASEFDHIGSVEDLPQLADGTSAQTQNTKSTAQEFALVVALGGTGADCLRTLRRRAGTMHNDGRLKLHSVLIDTSMASLDAMRETNLETSPGPCELICTPLKTAKEYRASGTERLTTISRRWIYNVPRSATTEGMRPLGRLALVDHGETVTKRLTIAIRRLISEAQGATPRVYVVGSLTGGTSSGMYLDVVHLLRHLLDSVGMEDASILSLLSTAPMQADPGYPIALYDAHAALIEMNHFLNAGNGYPGDSGAGWPSVPAARTPLHQVYVVAEPKAGSLSPTPVETIAEYVWADSTGSGDLLSSARKQDANEKSTVAGPTLHSVGVVPLADSNRVQEKILSPAVTLELLTRWLGLPAVAREQAAPFRDRIVRRIGLSMTSMVNSAADKLNQPNCQEALNVASSLLSERRQQDWSDVKPVLDRAVESIREEDDLKQICSDLMTRFFGQVSVALTDGFADVTTILESMKLIHETNLKVAAELRENCENQWVPSDPRSIHTIVARLVAAIHLEHINECLEYLQQKLERFATTLAMGMVQTKKMQGTETNPWEAMPDTIRSKFDHTVNQLHKSTVNDFVVRTLVDQTVNIDAGAMINHLHDAAIPLVEMVVREHGQSLADENTRVEHSDHGGSVTLANSQITGFDNLTKTAVPHQVQAVQALRNGGPALTVDQAVVAVKPALLEFGGQQRLILIVGTEQEREQFEPAVREVHDGSVTVVLIPGATPKLIHEARRIGLANVLSRMKMLNGDNARVTGRLSSRVDITW